MRIAVISTMNGFPWGGSEELWSAMVSDALTEGHEVAVSVYQWSVATKKVIALKEKGARIIPRLLPRYGRLNRIAQRFRSDLHELIAFKPDALCISNGGTYDFIYFKELADYLRTASIPYVVVNQFNNDAFMPDAATRAKTAELFARASRVAFVSGHNLRITERQLAAPLPNGIVLRNPVNLADTAAAPWCEAKIVSMASVARLEALYKGQDVLFEAMGAPEWRTRKWKLRLYGEGPDKSYLQSLAKHYNIKDQVEFMGHTNDIRKLWFDNHLLVMPSRAEGTPLALVEAMLCGRPAVVTDVGGNIEWIEESKTGFIAEAPTAKSFGAALERAWLAQEEWYGMGIRAHETAFTKVDHAPGKSLLDIICAASKPKGLVDLSMSDVAPSF